MAGLTRGRVNPYITVEVPYMDHAIMRSSPMWDARSASGLSAGSLGERTQQSLR